MKLLARLEKSFVFWALLVIALLFFFLRLPSLIEPYWYGDEGIYQVLGDSMRSGRLLYAGTWDNKPPLLYVVYALLGSDQFVIRLFSLFVGLLTVILFFLLARKLFSDAKLSLFITALFAFFYGIPFLEGNIANAENFILFFVILSGLVVYDVGERITSTEKWKLMIGNLSIQSPSSLLFFAGTMIGTAFLFKIVAIFDFAAFFIFLYLIHVYRKKISIIPFTFLNQAIYFTAGFLLPFLLSVAYFFFHGIIIEYIQGAFFSNVGYVNYGNKFIIPQGYLIAKALILTLVLSFLAIRRKKFQPYELFIIIWFLFSLFNAFFSQRPYTHYMLVLLPSYLLLFGLLWKKPAFRPVYAVVFIITTILVLRYFHFFPAKKTVLYYGNAFQFVTKQKDVVPYQSFFDRRTPRHYDIAAYIKSHTQPNDPLFIWGNVAQIYTLSETLPVGRYTVAYHISGREQAIKETDAAIEEKKPQYIVVFPDHGAPQISLSNYQYKLSIHEADIYERIN